MLSIENRRYFRIKYPSESKPELVTKGAKCEVVDISVGGIRFRQPTGKTAVKFAIAEKFVAMMGFCTGARVVVKGEVVKVTEEFIMVALNPHVPREILEKEADRLLELYGVVPTDALAE